jgi:hypothetical protein
MNEEPLMLSNTRTRDEFMIRHWDEAGTRHQQHIDDDEELVEQRVAELLEDPNVSAVTVGSRKVEYWVVRRVK